MMESLELADKFEIYEIPGAAPDKAWSWRLLNNKGHEIVKSEAGYPKEKIMGVVKEIREGMADALIIWGNPSDDPNKAGKDEGGETVEVPGSGGINDLIESLRQIELQAVLPGRVASNIDEELLIVKDYAPAGNKKPVCVALSLTNHPVNFPRKIWMSVDPSNISGGPRHHLAYREFVYDDVKYHPYSADLDRYTCDPESIVSLLKDVCGHIIVGH